MKKFTSLLLAGILLFLLFGCNSDKTENKTGGVKTQETLNQIEIGKTYTVNEYAEFKVRKIFTTDKMQSLFSDDGGFYENTTPDETYLDCVIDVKNLTSTTITSDKFLTATVKSFYGPEYIAEMYNIDENDYLNPNGELKPQATYTMHIATSIPSSEVEAKVILSFKEQNYSIDYTVGEVLSNAVPLEIGQTIGSEEYATLKVTDVEIAENADPSDTETVNVQNEKDNNTNTYLGIKANLINYQSSGKEPSKFVFAKAIFANKYEYSGFIVREISNGEDLSEYEPINPLENATVYILFEIPKTVAGMPYEISVMFNNQEYIISKK